MNGVLITLAILCIVGSVIVLMSGVGLIDNLLYGNEKAFGAGDIATGVLVIIMSVVLMLNITFTPNETDVIRGDATYVETLHLTQQGDTVRTYTLQYVNKDCK
jgi:uncharacterized membrane protein required for colicin V production